MNATELITLFGGLAMFLYGMHQMSDSIKENASGTLKILLEKVTSNQFRAFLLGIFVTAIIQSSSATIVITAGLVAAGVLTLHQSLGIIAGANIGTTITGQIIRLMDLGSSSGIASLLSPKTLAPLALIAGFLLISFRKIRGGKAVGSVLIGFGILFTGLLTMTSAVDSLSASGLFDPLYRALESPVISLLSGFLMALVLRGSATVGVFQTFSMSGFLAFHSVFFALLGVYFGDSTASYLTIRTQAKAEERRVAFLHVLYNIGKVFLIGLGMFAVVSFVNRTLWDSFVTPGNIADMNTLFNLLSAVFLYPLMPLLEKISRRTIKNDPLPKRRYADKLEALNPNFIATPALALNACYEAMRTIFSASMESLEKAYPLISSYQKDTEEALKTEEEECQILADGVSSYLGDIASFVEQDLQVTILNNYYRIMGDLVTLLRCPSKIAKIGERMNGTSLSFPEDTRSDLEELEGILNDILNSALSAFAYRDRGSAEEVEPVCLYYEERREKASRNQMEQLRKGRISAAAGIEFQKILSHFNDLKNLSSHIALMTICRIDPVVEEDPQKYLRDLRSLKDPGFTERYWSYREKHGKQPI
ncbi:MAG: Na/Pi cotransporter family protein [Erysipelotrichaceae bacterium]|nr:Na/Pi cotransporter family protein [Erysipelotrichaceae bacterium]